MHTRKINLALLNRLPVQHIMEGSADDQTNH